MEARYNNGYFHIHRPANINNPIDADLSWTVERRVAGDVDEPLAAHEREQFLAPNQLVPVGHAVLEPILEEIHAMRADESSEATAKAIYDWVVDNVEYKTVGTGWIRRQWRCVLA